MLAFHSRLREIHKLLVVNGLNRMINQPRHRQCAVVFIIFHESNMLAFHSRLREIYKLLVVNGLNRTNPREYLQDLRESSRDNSRTLSAHIQLLQTWNVV